MRSTGSNRRSGGRQLHAHGSRYLYRPCNPGIDEIRLLRVFPGLEFDDTVECSLKHYSLSKDVVEYAAVSYEWGNSSVRQRILIDGLSFDVTVNLCELLRELRSRGCPLLWIDQISLDQDDKLEKDVYIPKMGKIFETADYVYAWLGPASHGSHKLMRFLKDLEFDHRPNNARNQEPPELEDDELDAYRSELDALMRRGYWRRVWVIQEIALGTHVSVFCGSDKVSWRTIELLVGQLSKRTLFQGKAVDQAEHLCITRTAKRQDNPIGLLQAMYDSRASLATNPRDHVYALLGLVFDSHRYVDRPRYGASLTQISRSMTETVIRTRKSLDIIFAGPKHPESRSNLPSWCPDYFTLPSSTTMRHLSKYLSGQDERYRAGRLGRHWEATGGSAATSQTFGFVGAQGLEVLGVRIATINSLGCVLDDSRPPFHGSRSGRGKYLASTWINRTIDRVLSVYDRGYQTEDAESGAGPRMLHHLFAFDNIGQLSERKKRRLREKHASIIEWRRLNGGFTIKGNTLKTRSRISGSWAYGGRMLDAVVSSVASAAVLSNSAHSASARSLLYASNSLRDLRKQEKFPPDLDGALTSLGDLVKEGMRLMTTFEDDMGWAHPDAEVGDLIFLLEGCTMPAILRRSTREEKAYTVVGHVYVDGVMNNEVWSTVDRAEKRIIYIH